MDLDLRVVIVLLPIGLAAGWAGYNIAKAALAQVQAFLNKSS